MDDEKQAGKRIVLDNDGLHRRGSIWHYKIKIDGKWREYSTGTKNYQEARRARAETLETQKQGHPPADKGKLLFEKAAGAWPAARQEQKLAENTVRTEGERMQPLLARLSSRRLNSFRSDDIKNCQADRGSTSRSCVRQSFSSRARFEVGVQGRTGSFLR
jgi:hypothetical protein